MKSVIIPLIAAITFIANAGFEDWFPLAVGNKWQYEVLQQTLQYCPASSAKRYVINEIAGDTVIDGNNYFVMSSNWSYGIIRQLMFRYDSATQSITCRDRHHLRGISDCLFFPIRATGIDTFGTELYDNCRVQKIKSSPAAKDTVLSLGIADSVIKFELSTGIMSTHCYTLLKGIGIASEIERSEFDPCDSLSLVWAKINGVERGSFVSIRNVFTLPRSMYAGQKFTIVNGIPRPLERAIDLRGAFRAGFLRGIGVAKCESGSF